MSAYARKMDEEIISSDTRSAALSVADIPG
jgi:hypothetical protein